MYFETQPISPGQQPQTSPQVQQQPNGIIWLDDYTAEVDPQDNHRLLLRGVKRTFFITDETSAANIAEWATAINQAKDI
jgi:hypothetical protein